MQSLISTEDEDEQTEGEAEQEAGTPTPAAAVEEEESVVASSAAQSNGVSVQVFFLDAAGRPRLLTAGELFSCSAQDLVLLGRPTLGSVYPGVAGLLTDEELGVERFYDEAEDEGAEAEDSSQQLLLSDGQDAPDQPEQEAAVEVEEASGEAEADEAVGGDSLAEEESGLAAFVGASEDSWQCPSSLEELAASLWDAGVDVVVPIVSPSCSAAGAVLYGEVVGALEGAGLAVVGTTPEAAAAASDKWR